MECIFASYILHVVNVSNNPTSSVTVPLGMSATVNIPTTTTMVTIPTEDSRTAENSIGTLIGLALFGVIILLLFISVLLIGVWAFKKHKKKSQIKSQG